MALCSQCKKRQECKEICPALRKDITGRGKTASLKPKTYPIDFSYIEDPHQTHNSFQKDILSTLKDLNSGIKNQITNKLIIEEAIDKVLSSREKEIIQLFMEGYRQEEMARNLGISQPRVNFLLKRSLEKLKKFLEGL